MNAVMAGLLMIALGLVCGGFVGFVLGVEFAPRCVGWFRDEWAQYRKGLEDARRCSAGAFARRVRRYPGKTAGTYTVTADELKWIRREVEELDPE